MTNKSSATIWIVAALAIFSIFSFILPTYTSKPKPKLTPERAATHFIRYITKTGDVVTETGFCTGTAIAPHALLTAAHCNAEHMPLIQLDRGETEYHIVVALNDGKDHEIYLLDGPAFRNYVIPDPREARMGEHVTSYGCGNHDFPPHTYEGLVTPDNNGGDQSDVDEDIGSTVFDFSPIPGDSGSAVYNDDHKIVALITYGGDHGLGFPLDFPPKLYSFIQEISNDVNPNSGSSAKSASDPRAPSSPKTP